MHWLRLALTAFGRIEVDGKWMGSGWEVGRGGEGGGDALRPIAPLVLIPTGGLMGLKPAWAGANDRMGNDRMGSCWSCGQRPPIIPHEVKYKSNMAPFLAFFLSFSLSSGKKQKRKRGRKRRKKKK